MLPVSVAAAAHSLLSVCILGKQNFTRRTGFGRRTVRIIWTNCWYMSPASAWSALGAGSNQPHG